LAHFHYATLTNNFANKPNTSTFYLIPTKQLHKKASNKIANKINCCFTAPSPILKNIIEFEMQ